MKRGCSSGVLRFAQDDKTLPLGCDQPLHGVTMYAPYNLDWQKRLKCCKYNERCDEHLEAKTRAADGGGACRCRHVFRHVDCRSDRSPASLGRLGSHLPYLPFVPSRSGEGHCGAFGRASTAARSEGSAAQRRRPAESVLLSQFPSRTTRRLSIPPFIHRHL